MAMGHNPNTLTGANSVILFRCAGIYDNWVKLVGFQVDTAAVFGDVTVGETRIGVDGKQSGGFVAHETPLTINLEANSPSINVLENVYSDFCQNMETRLCEFQITQPSIQRKQSLSGFMTTKTGGASINKLLVGSAYNFSTVSNGSEEI
jgi:hypothetical protein